MTARACATTLALSDHRAAMPQQLPEGSSQHLVDRSALRAPRRVAPDGAVEGGPRALPTTAGQCRVHPGIGPAARLAPVQPDLALASLGGGSDLPRLCVAARADQRSALPKPADHLAAASWATVR